MLIDKGRLLVSPADITAHQACPHLLRQRIDIAHHRRKAPNQHSAHIDLIRQKGEEHEAEYLAERRSNAGTLVSIQWRSGERPSIQNWQQAATQTRRAMEAGVPLIYQATFLSESTIGRADFLERVDRPADPTALGPYGYEAVDTKLARAEKPDYALQLCAYS